MVVSIERQIACLDRELAMRRRVYRRWVAAGKMTAAKADEEIDGMETALQTLLRVRDFALSISRNSGNSP